MKSKWIAMLAFAGALGLVACETAEDDANVTADTALVPGQTTVETTVPTTDTVVRTREVDVNVDTIEGDTRDTLRR